MEQLHALVRPRHPVGRLQLEPQHPRPGGAAEGDDDALAGPAVGVQALECFAEAARVAQHRLEHFQDRLGGVARAAEQPGLAVAALGQVRK